MHRHVEHSVIVNNTFCTRPWSVIVESDTEAGGVYLFDRIDDALEWQKYVESNLPCLVSVKRVKKRGDSGLVQRLN